MAATSSRVTLTALAGRESRSLRIAPLAAYSTRQRLPNQLRRLATASNSPDGAKAKAKVNERYNYNTSLSFSEEPDPEHVNYRRVTASELVSRKEPPTGVKMLVRDFIDDSLYNPNYGYFSKHVDIFTPPAEGFQFSKYWDMAAFQEAVAERYESQYHHLPVETSGTGPGMDKSVRKQVWHTPTELFKPQYARSLTSAILSNHSLNHHPAPLTIYEIGAGNGSFMSDSVAFIRANHPDIYKTMKYRIIEISTTLSRRQQERADKEGFGDVVEVINTDFFKWTGPKDRRGDAGEGCYVVALEVFDNFAHDMVRYDTLTAQPLQAVVCITPTNDFTLLYEPITDPLLRRTMAYRRLLPSSPATSPLLPRAAWLRRLRSWIPFAPNLSEADFIPSKAVNFLERLRDVLPGHRLLVADFDVLPDAVKGRNGPVVQTMLGGKMVPCETFLVKQGYFDIFFPTDFEMLKDTYSLIMNSPSPTFTSPTYPSSSRRQAPSTPTIKPTPALLSSTASASSGLGSFFTPSTGIRGFRRRKVKIYSHAEFLQEFGGEKEIAATRTGDGESVMLDMYGNGKMMF